MVRGLPGRCGVCKNRGARSGGHVQGIWQRCDQGLLQRLPGRYRTLPVTERINAEGGIDTPLNEQEVIDAIEQFKQWDVKAIAVYLL